MAANEGRGPVGNVDEGDLQPATRREIERIRAKERGGETLTAEEAGVLRGAARTGGD